MTRWMTFFGLLLTVSAQAQVAQKPAAQPANQIICKEMAGSEADGGDGEGANPTVGIYTVDLDKADRVTRIEVQRQQGNGLPELKFTLTPKKTSIRHYKRSSELSLNWGIKEFEAIEARSKNGDRFEIHVNDHSYAGPVGSTVHIRLNGKKYDSDSTNMMDCTGKVWFPKDGGSVSDLDLDLDEDATN